MLNIPSPSESSAFTSSDRPQKRRLQRNAPPSIKINPVSSWNVAIPLLSPLASSAPSSISCVTSEEREEPPRQEKQVTEPEKFVFKMWQHPASPFYSESSPKLSSFVPV
ncbi:uncharacterized protein At4g14450, chloroplastic-like [Hibiscus syriacus]|uniref:uncharacterized protein At4g14450, chloroplastic-like n=1 Tax=Hibiscus syriacus TaxID=106335 RepID=UPI00192107C0|nr:uncharacterized protein At4g14450, chloroplastic-like [Hibiscus syriacus]